MLKGGALFSNHGHHYIFTKQKAIHAAEILKCLQEDMTWVMKFILH